MKNNLFHMIGNPIPIDNPRREFLKRGVALGTLTGLTGLGLVTGCKKEETEEVTPVEDLMREHGILNRIMLVYDTCLQKILSNEQFPVEALHEAAQMIRTFVEDYHEKNEEKSIFPRFVNSHKLVDLVQLLYVQHHAGRVLTEQILQLGNANTLSNEGDKEKLVSLLKNFNRMYRPHEAREDTVLFPALKSIVSHKEYEDMGEDFEKKEHELFGTDGFEIMVNKIGDIEKKLGIFDISQFTPAV